MEKTINPYKVFLIIITILLGIFLIRMCSNGTEVIHKEFSPSALLKKYEYFKDLSAAIDEKKANIEVYKSRLNMIQDKNSFEYNQTSSEMIGLISIENSLCADYNSAMSKFNYRFCNKGDLPYSNMETLPKEIKQYILTFN